jgi:competence protein ComEC
VVLLLPALTAKPSAPAEGQFRLTLLDVGQGLAAVVQTHAHALVFDTGPRFSPSFDTGAAVVEPFLRTQGVGKIDRLVISHGDNDHIGGAASLLRHFDVTDAYTSVPRKLPRAIRCLAGQAWEWDGVSFQFLAPFDGLEGDNNNSCVLRVASAAGSALLPADIEREAEQQLVDRWGAGLKSDVLIAPHHGSKTSSTVPFLAKVQPAWVLIPAGYLNRFGFPAPVVLSRYHNYGAKVMGSAADGAILFEPGRPAPVSWRLTHGKYWNAESETEDE